MNDGEAWWSKRTVVPERTASIAPTSPERYTDSSSSARSSRHQTFSRISTNVRGGSPGPDMPRARAL
jgi:hypothetical protein